MAVGRRDHRAFARLVERHYGWALGFTDRMLGARHEAEDLVQTAFLRVWQRAARWEPNAKFSTWLYRVLHNLCMDQLRARNAAASEPLDGEVVEALADEAPGSEERVSGLQRERARAGGTGQASRPATGGARSLLLRGAVAGGGRRAARGKRRRPGIAALTRARHAEEMAAGRSAIGKAHGPLIDLRNAAPPSVPSGAAGRSASTRFTTGSPIRRKAWRSSPKPVVPTASSMRSSLPPPDPRRARHIGALARPAWRRLGKPAAALAASAALGFVVGYLQSHSAADTGVVAQLLLGPQSLQEIGL